MPRRIWFAPVVAVLLAVGFGSAVAQPKFHVAEVDKLEQFAIEVGQTRLLMFDQAIGRIAVADPDVCDVQVVTPKQVLVTAKSVGYTHITLWGGDDVPTTITISSARNLDQLRVQLKELFVDEPIEVRSAGDLLVLSGRVSDLRLPARAAEVAMLYSEKIANLIEVSGDQQVQLDVRFAEVSRTGARTMGMDVLWNDGSVLNGSAGGITESNPAIQGPAGGAPLPFPQTVAGAFNFFFSTGLTEFPFSAVLSIMAREGLAKVLAEPTLVAMSGQEAEFHAGGEIPVLIAQALGQTNVQFKKFGIRLKFKPTVLAEKTITLKLFVEVSEPDVTSGVSFGGINIPAFKTRSSETTVRLKDGQSFAVAGLISDDTRQVSRKVPLLGDIPVLGALFRSTSFQREETELLVVVTARLVRPLTEDEIPLMPGEDEITDPSDFELFLFGGIKSDKREEEKEESKAAPAPAPAPEPTQSQGPTSTWTGGGGPTGPMGFSRGF